MSLREFYANALATEGHRTLAAAIAGLGETAFREDADDLIPYLSHPLARIRRAAVGSVMRLDGERYLDLVLDRVLDASPGVSDQARRATERHMHCMGAPRLWTLLSRSTLPHAQRNLLQLIAALPKWEAISYLVEACCSGDPRLAEQALRCVTRWRAQYNRRQTTPSQDQVARLEATLSKGETALPGLVASLRSALRAFTPS